MENVYVFDIGSIFFLWERITQKIYAALKNTGNNLTMKQMFDISEKLIVGQSDEIYGVNPINWEDSLWKQLSLVSDEEVISLSHGKVYFFLESVLCLGKMNQNPASNFPWEEKLTWFKSSSQYRTLDTNDGEPMEFEWNIFPGFTTLQLCNKVQEFMSKMSDPSELKGRIIFMSMFNDMSWGSEGNEQECDANVNARRFPPGTWSFLAKQERGDLCWQDNLTHCLRQQVCWRKHLHLPPMILRKKISCKSTKNEWKDSHNKIVWLKFVLMQDSWQQLESDSTSWQSTLKSSHNLQNQWHVVSALCQEMKNHLNRKVGFEGTPKLGPC